MNFLQKVIFHNRINARNFTRCSQSLTKHRKYQISTEKPLEETIKELLEQSASPDDDHWRRMKTTLLKSVRKLTSDNVDATIVGFCMKFNMLEEAKSFVTFLENDSEMGEVNPATLAKLMRVYAVRAEHRSLQEAEEKEIFEIYRKLKEKFEVFDGYTAEGVISSLSLTSRWRECYQLIKTMSLLSVPSVGTYSSVVEAAFRNSEEKIAIETIRKAIREGRIPKCSVWIAWIDFCSREKRSIEAFLTFIQDSELQISDKVVRKLEEHLESLKIPSWRTDIAPDGTCQSCLASLQPITVTDENFTQLQEQFLQKVLIREDVFLKSNPKEVEDFRRFIEREKPFNCIVDGLNVAFAGGKARNPERQAKNVINIVRHFSRKGQKVLVLGRKHMKGWPQEHLRMLNQHALLFLTDNLSQDDPFLLFAALTSGKDCTIVSRDLMRQHSHLLDNEDVKKTFRKWQHTHQFRLETNPGSRIAIKSPPIFSVTAHAVDRDWHVPYQPSYSPYQLDLFEVPSQWLCFHLPLHESAPK
ncbi:Ribonuclease P [Sergentomyia squamirostris]